MCLTIYGRPLQAMAVDHPRELMRATFLRGADPRSGMLADGHLATGTPLRCERFPMSSNDFQSIPINSNHFFKNMKREEVLTCGNQEQKIEDEDEDEEDSRLVKPGQSACVRSPWSESKSRETGYRRVRQEISGGVTWF